SASARPPMHSAESGCDTGHSLRRAAGVSFLTSTRGSSASTAKFSAVVVSAPHRQESPTARATAQAIVAVHNVRRATRANVGHDNADGLQRTRVWRDAAGGSGQRSLCASTESELHYSRRETPLTRRTAEWRAIEGR